MKRRTFLQTTAGAAGVLALPVLQGCGNDVSVLPYIDAQVVDDSTSEFYGMVPIVVGMYPALAVGSAATIRIAALPDGERPFDVPPSGVILVHRGDAGDDNDFVAGESACPHAGCPLSYNAKADLIECPCHGSRFRSIPKPDDKKTCGGDVVHAPAKSNILMYTTHYQSLNDTLYIDLGTRIACNSLPAPVAGVVTVSLTDATALQDVGGWLVSSPIGFDDTLILIRTDDTTVVALSSVCTHKHCNVGYRADLGLIKCPCHGSQYNLNGDVLHGPAENPLTDYPASFDGTNVTITVGNNK